MLNSQRAGTTCVTVSIGAATALPGTGTQLGQLIHTAAACAHFTSSFRQLLADLKSYPDSGAPIEAAREVGMDVRQRLCEEIRVVYHHDKAHGIVYIRMLLPTRRDFLSHLTGCILRPDF